MSGGKVASTQDSTLVKISTDDGIVGWGETCGFSPNYIAAHGAGARAAIREMAPALIGLDPRQIEIVYARMDGALMGHYYAKSAPDMACWDILGKSTGLPISDLLGGTFQPTFPLYVGVGIGTPEAMQEICLISLDQGYRRLQIKVGGGWRRDLERVEKCLEVLGEAEIVIVDANCYWPQHEAAKIVAALEGSPVYIEQPCATITECASLRKRSQLPFILDESLKGFDDIVIAREAGAMDAVMLKMSRFGGITPIRKVRDLCQQWGLAMTIEDSGGGDVVSSAMAHLTGSVRPGYTVNGFLINSMVNEHFAEGAPEPKEGKAEVPKAPGLGVQVDEAALGKAEYSVY